MVARAPGPQRVRVHPTAHARSPRLQHLPRETAFLRHCFLGARGKIALRRATCDPSGLLHAEAAVASYSTRHANHQICSRSGIFKAKKKQSDLVMTRVAAAPHLALKCLCPCAGVAPISLMHQSPTWFKPDKLCFHPASGRRGWSRYIGEICTYQYRDRELCCDELSRAQTL